MICHPPYSAKLQSPWHGPKKLSPFQSMRRTSARDGGTAGEVCAVSVRSVLMGPEESTFGTLDPARAPVMPDASVATNSAIVSVQH